MNSMLRIALSAGSALLLAGFIAGAASADITGNTNTSTQTGVNSSASTQQAAAVSGNATSVDEGVAESGAATAETVFEGAQVLTAALLNQSASGDADIDTNTNTATQAATNALANAQANGAVSGAASAEDTGSSTTGTASSAMANVQAQIQALIQANQSIAPAPESTP